ncbi:MAG: gliding motility-associated C-terminal domain-containing protein [Saprospiraceae bacterium]
MMRPITPFLFRLRQLSKNVLGVHAFRIALLAVLGITASTAFAQVPSTVFSDGYEPINLDLEEVLVPCGLNDAGTIIPGPSTAMSNDLNLDTLFLCWNDEILIDHNGDQRLDGDPDPSTQAGVGYAWYECPPSVDGPTLGAVAADPCLIPSGATPAGSPPFFVSTGGRFDGDIQFFNQGAIQSTFNAGDPYLVWFAPITFDSLVVNGTSSNAFFENGGSCVSVRPDAAFAVVYLNELTITNVQVNNCTASFVVDGGLPEYRVSDRYTFQVVNTADATVTGTVSNPDAAAGDRVTFAVPQAGNYEISVIDEKGCTATSRIADLTACAPVPKVTVTIDTLLGAPGATVCLPVYVEGFQNIFSFQFLIDYNEVLMRFTGVQNASITPFNAGSEYNDDGDALFVGTFTTGAPFSVADGGVLFEACFEVLGVEGDFAEAAFAPPISGFEFVNSAGVTLDYCFVPGGIAVTTNTIALLATQTGFGCGGEDENFFQAQVAGGVAPYSLTWQRQGGGPLQGPAAILVENQTFVSPASLSPGTYDVIVTDSGGNTDTVVLTITDGPELDVFIDRISELSCAGDTNGALTARVVIDFTTLSNPGAGYSFNWTGGRMTQAINNLGIGNYSVTVTDPRGCTATTSSPITAPPALTLNVMATDATCEGLMDGNVTVTPSGGTPLGANYTYNYTLPSGTNSNATGANLSLNGDPGRYDITVIDDNGCRSDTFSVLGALREVSLAETVTEIRCAGEMNGEITVLAGTSSGTPALPYSFNWAGIPAGSATNTPTVSTIAGLGQGTFRLIATDNDGCIARDTFTLIEPSQLQISLVGSGDESCNPGSDGFGEVTAIGGRNTASPYVFEWRDDMGALIAGTPRADGLTEGGYRAYVVDASGCIDSLVNFLAIDAPDKPSILSFDNDSLDCNGFSDGVLDVLAQANGSPINRYEWNTSQTGSTLTGLAAGEYIVSVFDDAGCVTTDTALVVEPDPLSILDTILTTPPCYQQGNGVITINPTGGTGPYSFEWSSGTMGVDSNTITGASISEGTYVVTITDANNCPSIQEVYTLDDAPSIDPDFDVTSVIAASCAVGVCDGAITVSAALPGSPGASFDFTWDSGESTLNDITSRATMLCGGRREVDVQETSLVCPPQTFTINIPAPDPLVLDIGIFEEVRCFGESNGLIVVDTVFGGAPGFTFAWDTPVGMQTGPRAQNLTAGQVTLEVRDSDGCPLLDTFLIEEPPVLDLVLDAVGTLEPTCAGYDDGIISLDISGGNAGAGYTFRWNDDPNRNATIARDVAAGSYTVVAIDRLGCVDSVVVTLNEPDAIFFELSPFDPILCFGDLSAISVDTAYGGQGLINADFEVSVNNSSFQPVGQQFQVPGGVVVPITVTDPAGCAVSDEILIPSPAAITLRLPTEVEVELGDSVRLRPDIFPGGAAILFDSIRWTPDTSVSFRNGVLADPYVSPTEETTYTITVIDEDGCTASASILVLVDRNRNVFIPNAFSPNNDATNDELQIFTGPGVQSINYFRVFNRWGEEMYAEENVALNPNGQTAGWDGTARGRRVATGVYVYIAEITFEDGRVIVYKGDVSVMY